jgi:hypothetical protein
MSNETTNSADGRSTVAKAIKFLAAACDHALVRDGVGFAKSTASPGHELAALGPARWNDEMWTYASLVAANHANQLFKTRVITESELSELRIQSGRRMKSPHLPTNWVDLSEIDGKPAVVVSNSFSKVLTTILERLPASEAYQPAGTGRLWRISGRFAFVLSHHSTEIDFLSSAAEDMVRKSLASATNDDRILGHHGPIVELSDGLISFCMGFDHALHAELKRGKGGRIDVGKSWQDVTYTVAADRRGHDFMQMFLSVGFNPVFREGVIEEIGRLANVEPVIVAPRPQTDSKLDICLDEIDDVVLIRFRPFNQSWLDAIKTLPQDVRSYSDGAWRVSADRHVLEQLADGIAAAGADPCHARAAIAIHDFIMVSKVASNIGAA